MTSMKVRSKPRPCAQATRSGASPSLKPLSATALILTFRPGGVRRVDPRHHLVEVAPARHGAELVGIERVERDVDPPHAAIGELGGEAGELRAVGGQRQLVERAAVEMTGKRAEQGHDPAPDQGLAAGDAQLARPHPHEGRAQPVELLERQHVRLGQEGHVFRHAIDAAEVAAVGDRHAHVADRPAERIDQRRRGGGSVRVHARDDNRLRQRKKGEARRRAGGPLLLDDRPWRRRWRGRRGR